MIKVFLRHQLPYICLYILSVSLLGGIFWLDGYRNWQVLLYGALLSVTLLLIYLIVYFFSHHQLYKMLGDKDQKLLFDTSRKDISFFSKQVNELLLTQQKMSYDEMVKIRDSREEHLKFIHLWVHQMKTPLAVIDLMIQSGELDKQNLLEETEKINDGLRMALNMARIESFETDFVIEKSSLNHIVHEVIQEQKRNFIRHRVYPKVLFHQEYFVETDKKWLQFSLYQIVSNSIKYSSGKGTSIEFDVIKKGDNLQLVIRDYGAGIAPEDLPRVFDPFFTGSQGRIHQEATGMGLYLVREIFEQLDHQIEIESDVGKGTTVRLMFSNFMTEM
ncbi:sensor histidine kinase [Vagococcus elongatus]|uniref:histidine kinase n=1 Tax=Vagococcus elongatus TaxID=180344 RepID=A0A430B216_9ENTE|nr:sensor histidine kinase [Vagococcus elongatus]RSU14360.1 hypothetical protein CBF29_03415 [Vagococcus elongatus]